MTSPSARQARAPGRTPWPVIDEERFSDISATDPVLEGELITILLENLDARVSELTRLGAASEPAQVARIAHAIRGVALNFGAPRLAAAAHAIEALARAGAVADDDAEALVQEVDLVRVALQTRLALRR